MRRKAKTVRAWAMVEGDKITLLIYEARRYLVGEYLRANRTRRIARVEIREVVRKKPRKRGRS